MFTYTLSTSRVHTDNSSQKSNVANHDYRRNGSSALSWPHTCYLLTTPTHHVHPPTTCITSSWSWPLALMTTLSPLCRHRICSNRTAFNRLFLSPVLILCVYMYTVYYYYHRCRLAVLFSFSSPHVRDFDSRYDADGSLLLLHRQWQQ